MNFKIVILSAQPTNLIACVCALFYHEPQLPRECILVVDDGARLDAEAELPGITWLQGVKPFVYARNANLGIQAAETDVILLNDDARLITPHGFTQLAQQMAQHPQVGVLSAGIRGVVDNRHQVARAIPSFRREHTRLAFVCVYLRRAAYERVGPLDGRFVGYGFEDDDYSARLREAGFALGIWDGCVVDHSGVLPSSFRTRRDFKTLLRQNRSLFLAKRIQRTRPRA